MSIKWVSRLYTYTNCSTYDIILRISLKHAVETYRHLEKNFWCVVIMTCMYVLARQIYIHGYVPTSVVCKPGQVLTADAIPPPLPILI